MLRVFHSIWTGANFPCQAYTLTIEKAHGQTFGKVGVRLGMSVVFGHGQQLYVALSKVDRWEGLSVLAPRVLLQSSGGGGLFPAQHLHGQDDGPQAGVYVANVVFKEALVNSSCSTQMCVHACLTFVGHMLPTCKLMHKGFRHCLRPYAPMHTVTRSLPNKSSPASLGYPNGFG
jgi:hypothetical protein